MSGPSPWGSRSESPQRREATSPRPPASGPSPTLRSPGLLPTLPPIASHCRDSPASVPPGRPLPPPEPPRTASGRPLRKGSPPKATLPEALGRHPGWRRSAGTLRRQPLLGRAAGAGRNHPERRDAKFCVSTTRRRRPQLPGIQHSPTRQRPDRIRYPGTCGAQPVLCRHPVRPWHHPGEFQHPWGRRGQFPGAQQPSLRRR